MFIVFEGIDGCGKTTIVKKIAKLLRKIPKYKNKIIITAEPNGTKIGQNIQKIILKNKKIDKHTETLLYAASRRQNIIEKIKPNLKNKIILCDRFIDSSIVYQGFVKKIKIQKVLEINLFAINKIKPNITFVIDVDVQTSLARIKNRKKKKNRFDLEKINFHEKARQGFLKISQNKDHILINGNQKIDQIVNKIYDEIIKYLQKNKKNNEKN